MRLTRRDYERLAEVYRYERIAFTVIGAICLFTGALTNRAWYWLIPMAIAGLAVIAEEIVKRRIRQMGGDERERSHHH